jgi:hypothetical protein
MDDLSLYSKEPLTPEELARTRQSIRRTDKLWPKLGPITTVLWDWKFWAPVATAIAALNYPWLTAALAAFSGAGQ